MNEARPTTIEVTADEADRHAIERAAMDYYEGWFEADPDRMARALHQALVKRSFNGRTDGAASELSAARTADEMVALTRAGGGSDIPGPHNTRITIDQLSGGLASVSASSGPYVEFLHLVKTTDGWRIVNVLWRFGDGYRPRA